MMRVKFSSVSNVGAVDAYKFYKKKYPKTTVTYTLYKYVVSEFNKKVSELILEGHSFNMGHRLSSIRIKKIARSFNKPTVDWGETNKLRKEGIKTIVYYTDDFYFRWHWEKARCLVKNKSVYSFTPNGGVKGNKRALVTKLKQDEFAYLNFK
jgi:hypothetical protein